MARVSFLFGGKCCKLVHVWTGHSVRASTDNPAAIAMQRCDFRWWRTYQVQLAPEGGCGGGFIFGFGSPDAAVHRQAWQRGNAS